MPAPAASLMFVLLLTVQGLRAGLPAPQESLALAFPGARIQRQEHFLTDAQAQKVKALAGVELSGLWWVAYEAHREGRIAGVAFFDTHRVRTLNGTAMVAVNADGTLRRVEVVAFREPQEYLPKDAWMRQLDGKRLDENLSLKRAIRPLSGATLTATAMVEASRRGLALYQVIYQRVQ